MIWSTLNTSSAASAAEINAYSFTLKHSVTPNTVMSSIFPSVIFKPAVVLPLKISLLKF